MKKITVKNITLNEGLPKIIVPIVDQSKETILRTFKSYQFKEFDMIEWRIDYYEDILNIEKFTQLIDDIKFLNIHKPILFTYRSIKEGGQAQIEINLLKEIYKVALEADIFDIYDVELKQEDAKSIIEIIKQKQRIVLLSHHNFEYTPSNENILRIFNQMRDLNADILKLAVMPNTKQDVLRLMQFTLDCSQCMEQPLITITMGELGKLSRISGQIYNSCCTFATVDHTSAPGQLNYEVVNDILEQLNHETFE